MRLSERFAQHCGKWRACTACPLHQNAHKKALHRGDLPAKILMVGEGPGSYEDYKGQPFSGPAGRLLNAMIDDAKGRLREEGIDVDPVTIGITNIVACMPLDDHGKIRKPSKKEAVACSLRLKEVIEMSKPKVIVTIGEPAKQHLSSDLWKGKRLHILHPAAILRLDDKKSGTEFDESQIVPIKGATLRIVQAMKIALGIG
jgi:uracil-DNA glycosylase family 4